MFEYVFVCPQMEVLTCMSALFIKTHPGVFLCKFYFALNLQSFFLLCNIAMDTHTHTHMQCCVPESSALGQMIATTYTTQ